MKNLCLFKIGTLDVLLQSKPEGDCSLNGSKRKKTEAKEQERKIGFLTSVNLQTKRLTIKMVAYGGDPLGERAKEV